MNRSRAATLLLASSLTACGAMHTTPNYAPSTDNFLALGDLKGQRLNVGNFTSSASASEVGCRAVGIKPPNNTTFAAYVRNAFVREFSSVGIFVPGADVTLTGNLDALELSSFTGEWSLTLTLHSSNGRAMTVNSKTSFSATWDGKTACDFAANAFVPATQSLIAKTIATPGFLELIR